MKQLATIIIASLVCSASQAQTRTLAECISMGIDNNLSLRNARIGMEKGRLGVTQNRSRLLPVIQGVAQFSGYLMSPVNVTTGTLLDKEFPDDPTWQTIKSMKYQSNAGILLNIPIYNQTILSSVDVAKTVESIQGLSYEKAREELTVQIGKVYYLAQTSKEQLRLTDQNLSRMDEICLSMLLWMSCQRKLVLFRCPLRVPVANYRSCSWLRNKGCSSISKSRL